MTVGDIAFVCRRPDETYRQAVNRVRNWSKVGLIGKREPVGTGHRRAMTLDDLHRAVRIQEMIDTNGCSAIWAAARLT